MKRFVRWASLLYPKHWRERYGAEFEALIDQTKPDLGTSFDIMKGAIRVHVTHCSLSKVLVLSALLGALVAFCTSVTLPKQYVSEAMITFAPSTGGQAVVDRINVLVQATLRRTTLTRIILAFDLYQNERQRKPVEDVLGVMRKSIEIRPVAGVVGGSFPAFTVGFSYKDRIVAQQVTRDLVSRLVDEDIRASNTADTSLQLLDPASLPENPISPKLPTFLGIGVAAGLALGGFGYFVRRKLIPDLADGHTLTAWAFGRDRRSVTRER